MDQLEILGTHQVCNLIAGNTGNGEFPEGSIIRENSKMVLSPKLGDVLEIMIRCERSRCKSAYRFISSTKGKMLPVDTTEGIFSLQANDPLMRKIYLFVKGRSLRVSDAFLDAVRFLEPATVIDSGYAPLDNMVDRELAACYAMLGWLDKCKQLEKRLLKKLMQYCPSTNRESREVISYATITRPGEDARSYERWERDVFGANNSRAQSSQTCADGHLVAARNFDRGDLIFIERPVVGNVAESKGQCNACTLKTLHAIPCPDCCAVFYCSLQCCEKDSHFHRYECYGYKILFFPLVNGILPLRLLVKALDILKHALAAQPPAKCPLSVGQLWRTLVQGCEEFPDFKVLLEHPYEYSDLREADYRTQLLKTRSMFQYITTSGELAKDYGECWTKACDEETRDMFIAGLLLRLSTITMLKSACYTYVLPYEGSKWRGEGDSDQPPSETYLVPTLMSRNRFNLITFWSDCVRKAAESDSMNETDLLQKAVYRYCTDYASTFDPFETHLRVEKWTINQYHAMYRFAVDMLHSNVPNTVAILLDDGVVAFRARIPIKQGQYLTYAQHADSLNGGQEEGSSKMVDKE